MSLLIPEIMAVRSLHKELREVTVSEETTRAIQRIHECLKTGMDSQGWSRVDWRSRTGGTARPYGGSNGGHVHGSGPVGSNYRGFTSRGATGSAGSGLNIVMNRTGPSGNSSGPVSSSMPSRPPPAKYVSRFKTSTERIDDTILNTVILGKLNKFSPANYNEIKEFMCQILDSGETDFLKEFMKLVFQKATTEEIFCPLYARLLSELSDKYTILLEEMIILYKEYMAIFGEVDEADAANYDEFVTRTSQKKYRLGYSQFLAELVKHNVLDRDLLIQTIQLISTQVPKVASNSQYSRIGEEYADCLLKIVCALADSKSESSCSVCSQVKLEISPKIHPYTVKSNDNKLTMKARFALLDVYERLDKKVYNI
jgi:hypothetical protein